MIMKNFALLVGLMLKAPPTARAYRQEKYMIGSRTIDCLVYLKVTCVSVCVSAGSSDRCSRSRWEWTGKFCLGPRVQSGKISFMSHTTTCSHHGIWNMCPFCLQFYLWLLKECVLDKYLLSEHKILLLWGLQSYIMPSWSCSTLIFSVKLTKFNLGKVE